MKRTYATPELTWSIFEDDVVRTSVTETDAPMSEGTEAFDQAWSS